MKSTRAAPAETNGPLPFPKLMEFIEGKFTTGPFIVLFSEPKKGVVVWTDNPNTKLGTFGFEWHAASFRDYLGAPITLENSK